jgi:hypothetical protein
MWETDKDGLKMMRCQWFNRPGETLLSDHSLAKGVTEHPREVFLDESGEDENYMTTIGVSTGEDSCLSTLLYLDCSGY